MRVFQGLRKICQAMTEMTPGQLPIAGSIRLASWDRPFEGPFGWLVLGNVPSLKPTAKTVLKMGGPPESRRFLGKPPLKMVLC